MPVMYKALSLIPSTAETKYFLNSDAGGRGGRQQDSGDRLVRTLTFQLRNETPESKTIEFCRYINKGRRT